ncbi:MAG: hypothetical protein M1834_004385 [Cirrosporium novae-zelandiae]|nr:MAG: hypothetical protein M1834_004385 [Cirrosporium novae-zelandiae]
MYLEDQRHIHEDLERLEQGISDRILEDPKNIKDHLSRDHQIASFLDRIQEQSQRLLDIYKDAEGLRAKEIRSVSTGDPFDEFYRRLEDIKQFHRQYPNEPVENLERAYKQKAPGEGDFVTSEIEHMFTGEESYGRFLDLTTHHEEYLNLPGIKRLNYLHYLDAFDHFGPPQMAMKKSDKMSDRYFKYLGNLVKYLEGFMRRTKPLEDLDKLFSSFDEEFEKDWAADKVSGWGSRNSQTASTGPKTEGTGEGIWCQACEKEFSNQNVYKNHLTGKKHIRAAAAKEANGQGEAEGSTNGPTNHSISVQRLKERAIADREFRIQKLTAVLQRERTDTRVNVERKQGMTEREREMELEALYAEDNEPTAAGRDEDSDSDGEEKIYNPLKLPLAWDGKPIPYWLYKLHGLGVEFPCEICGNFVYMGRRAFDKHFSESRHIYGLKCLGITNTTLFREITGIQDALNLWNKIQSDKKKEKTGTENVVQMEDADGNVMPEKVYYDLQKQGLL